jgi:hypothetical protein
MNLNLTLVMYHAPVNKKKIYICMSSYIYNINKGVINIRKGFNMTDIDDREMI